MAIKIRKEEVTEKFIDVFRDERNLWDVKSSNYKVGNEKVKGYMVFNEKLGMEG